MGGFLGEMGFGLVGDKMGNLGFWVAGGGWVRWRRAGGDVLVVGEVMGGGGLGEFWMLGRKGTEKVVSSFLYGCWKMGEGGKM